MAACSVVRPTTLGTISVAKGCTPNHAAVTHATPRVPPSRRTSANACAVAETSTPCRIDNGFTSCTCDANDSVFCSSTRFSAVGINTESTTSTVSDTTVGPTAGQPTGQVRSVDRQ